PQEVLADLAGWANQLGLAVVHEVGSPASGSSARPGGRVRRFRRLTHRPLVVASAVPVIAVGPDDPVAPDPALQAPLKPVAPVGDEDPVGPHLAPGLVALLVDEQGPAVLPALDDLAAPVVGPVVPDAIQVGEAVGPAAVVPRLGP